MAMATLDGGWQSCFEGQVGLLVFVTTEPGQAKRVRYAS